MRRFAYALALPFLALPLAGPAAAQGVDIVATTGMIGDIAARVAGECASVATLMGPGVDPHLYRASAGDVRRFQEADLVLYSGLGLEGQVAEVLERLSDRLPTLAAGEAVPEDRLMEEDGALDPHVWMDAALWAATVPAMADTIAERAPDCADALEVRAQTLQDDLAALDGWARESLATVPEASRLLVTAHDAFGYFGRAYGIEVFGIQGVSTEAEAGVGDIRDAAARLVEANVPTVFVESTINPRTVEAVTEAASQAGHAVSRGPELYADALGEAGTPAATYAGMIVSNVRAIAEGLGGEALPLPARLEALVAPPAAR